MWAIGCIAILHSAGARPGKKPGALLVTNTVFFARDAVFRTRFGNLPEWRLLRNTAEAISLLAKGVQRMTETRLPTSPGQLTLPEQAHFGAGLEQLFQRPFGFDPPIFHHHDVAGAP